VTYSLGNCCSIQLSYESVRARQPRTGAGSVAARSASSKIVGLTLLGLIACGGDPIDSGPAKVAVSTTRPWRADLPPLVDEVGEIRGHVPLRAIIHLHSPWSHDACDGEGLIDGQPNEACLADLRSALCRTAIDIAFVTDHPDYAAIRPYEEALLARDGDRDLTNAAGAIIGTGLACDDGLEGREPLWLPGIEDELMPVGLQRAAGGGTVEEAHALYNELSEAAISAEVAAGAHVLVNHTEGRERETLEAIQDWGGTGVEIFNLHAAFDPRIRGADLGLDPAGWMAEIADFTGDDGSAEPDLYFLAVLDAQTPSLASWDALQSRGPSVGVAGTDAHQNVMPILLRDGERGDSYRRMLRWFSNVIVAESRTPEAAMAALGAGRVYVAFEALGTPVGVDLHLVSTDGTIFEMGSDAPSGELIVGCPALSVDSPQGTAAPEIVVNVLRDGVQWAEGCGRHVVDDAGSYRVEVSMTPHHLVPFLGETPEMWMKPTPWVYTNPIRVTVGR
jgi:hypothetical protein